MKSENMQLSNRIPYEEKLLARENRADFLILLSKLGPLDRDMLVMKVIEGNSYKEIALNMGMVECMVEERINCTFQKWSSHKFNY